MLTTPSPVEVTDLARWRAASDAELLAGLEAARVRVRQAQAAVAVISAEVARRSAPEAGHAGLAQRTGARTPEKLVARITGTSEREARDMVTAGRLTAEAPLWLSGVAAGVRDGSLSVGQASAIATGLGEPSARVAADDLQDAARRLAGEAATLDADRLARRARDERDALDAAGVVDRERELRTRRSLRWTRLPDGMTSLRALLDPESAAVVTAALDAVTSPRRGGPRFVDADEVARAGALQHDARSTEQLALDALVQMVRAAVAVDDGRMLGQRQPTVSAARPRRRPAGGLRGRASRGPRGPRVDRDRRAARLCRGLSPRRHRARRLDRRRPCPATLHGPAAPRPSRRSGVAARSPTASGPRRGRKRTTLSRGRAAAGQMSRTESCSVATTTC